MLQRFIWGVPQLIILGALGYYLIKKKNLLGYILFFSQFVAYVLGLISNYITFSSPGTFLMKRARLLSGIGTISFIMYLIFAIAFFKLIKDILKENTANYNLLDDSKLNDTLYKTK